MLPREGSGWCRSRGDLVMWTTACAALTAAGACQAAPSPVSEASAPEPIVGSRTATELPDVPNATFAYLLSRYDRDGDLVLERDEYVRRDGQFERWDTDADGRLTSDDWGGNDLEVSPQITELARRRVLGRSFQVDDDVTVLTIDELVQAFTEHYDGADGSAPDEELSEAEFRIGWDEHATSLPGDESMQMASYSGGRDAWGTLVGLQDTDGSGRVSLLELVSLFEQQDLYELRFDPGSADSGGDEELDYRVGLPTGTPVPDLRLAALHGDETVGLRDFVQQKPVALIFGSYT